MIKLSCASLSFDGFDDIDYVNTFEYARKAGYSNIEFNMWYPSNFTLSKIRDIKQRLQFSCLEASSIQISSFGGEGHHNLAKDICHKIRSIDIAIELGCKRIVATGYERGQQGGLQSIIEVLKELVPIAEEKGVIISLENHVNNNLENTEDYSRIFDQIDSPVLGICMDTGHFEAAGVDLNTFIDSFFSKINHIHLKENKGFGKKNFVQFGKGTTNNSVFVNKMISLGYSGYLVVEVSPEIAGDERRMDFELENVAKPFRMFSSYQTE